jgi:hypothetical protein
MTAHAPHQKGAAILAAMLTVSFVATFAIFALWQQWRAIEVERAERERVQISWLLDGAGGFARLLLREDARDSGHKDHLAEPWAVGLNESKLSSFLLAGQDNTSTLLGDEMLEAFLSGSIVDAQSRLNLRNLVQDAQLSVPDLAAWRQLFQTLGLPAQELDLECRQIWRVHFANGKIAIGADILPILGRCGEAGPHQIIFLLVAEGGRIDPIGQLALAWSPVCRAAKTVDHDPQFAIGGRRCRSIGCGKAGKDLRTAEQLIAFPDDPLPRRAIVVDRDARQLVHKRLAHLERCTGHHRRFVIRRSQCIVLHRGRHGSHWHWCDNLSIARHHAVPRRLNRRATHRQERQKQDS